MTDHPNKLKGHLITSALNRAERAISAGFYLETLALCDSLITDRIRVIGVHSTSTPIEIRGVNDGLVKLDRADISILDSTLVDETRKWGKQRNAAIHGFSKLSEFDGVTWLARLKQARIQAELGVGLAKRWLSETKRHRL
jgi:hypothetical protein